MIAQVSPQELAAWRDDAAREPPLVLDVRERWEYDYCRIEPSLSMPLGELAHRVTALPRNRDIVVVCHHGVRSLHAAAWLARSGFPRVHNLAGGLAAWSESVEPSMKRY